MRVKIDNFTRGVFQCDDRFITAPSRALSGHCGRSEMGTSHFQSSPAAGLEAAQAPAARLITKAVRISLYFFALRCSQRDARKPVPSVLAPFRVSANRFIGFKLLVNLVSGSAEWVSHFRSASRAPCRQRVMLCIQYRRREEGRGEEKRCRGP